MLESIGGKDPRLRAWVRDLVFHPEKPQKPLLLTGPGRRNKALFHDAMSLLLPPGAVHQVWTPTEPLVIDLRAWLMVIEDYDQNCIDKLGGKLPSDSWHVPGGNHWVKWSLTQSGNLIVPRNTLRFDVPEPRIFTLQPNVLRRLERESQMFRRSLARAA